MRRIIKRTLIIFLIGLFLNAFPYHFNFGTVRYFGVLQRIAVCYFLGAVLFLTTRIRTQAMIAALLLLGYWIFMSYVPVPGYGINLTEEAIGQVILIDWFFQRLIYMKKFLIPKDF